MKRSRGFSLIELLVVIAIIAILAAILFPIFLKAKVKANQTSCASNLSQIQRAISMYMSDNGDRFPWATEYQCWDKQDALLTRNLRDLLSTGTRYSIKCTKYITKTNVFCCPSDVGFAGISQIKSPCFKLYGTSYDYRGYIPHLVGKVSPDNYSGYTWLAGTTTSSLRSPLSKIIMCNDIWVWHAGDGATQYTNEAPSKESGRVNCLYADGHIKSLAYTEFIKGLYLH